MQRHCAGAGASTGTGAGTGVKRLLSSCLFWTNTPLEHTHTHMHTQTHSMTIHNGIVRPKCFLSYFADVCRKKVAANLTPPSPAAPFAPSPPLLLPPQSLYAPAQLSLFAESSSQQINVNSQRQKLLKNCGKSLHDKDLNLLTNTRSNTLTHAHTCTHTNTSMYIHTHAHTRVLGFFFTLSLS